MRLIGVPWLSCRVGAAPLRATRGLSVLELILALAVTAIVATAIAGMMGAVSAGVGSRRDARGVMVRAHAAAARLSAYIAPSRCILAANSSDVVLWFDDARQSDTVHVSEVRWLIFDAAKGTVDVHYFNCPDNWSRTACDLEDQEFAVGSDWSTVRATYAAKGMIATRTLVDDLRGVAVSIERATPASSRFVSHDLDFEAGAHVVTVTTAAALTQHSPPSK